MSVVIDASITLSWYFEDERTQASNSVLDQVTAAGAVVPSLWKLETANGLQIAIRRQRIDAAFRDLALFHVEVGQRRPEPHNSMLSISGGEIMTQGRVF